MGDIVTLDQVRSFLQFPADYTANDAILSDPFIPAATDVINRETGINPPTQYDEYYDGGDRSIWLRNVPVLEISLVEEGWGWINYTLDQVQVNSNPAGSMYAYSVDSPESGYITRRSAGNVSVPFVKGESNIHVIYTSGRNPIPGAVALAALQLIAHWYQNALQRWAGSNDAYDAVAEDFTRTTALSSINAGVPYAIIEMLKPFRREPIIG